MHATNKQVAPDEQKKTPLGCSVIWLDPLCKAYTTGLAERMEKVSPTAVML